MRFKYGGNIFTMKSFLTLAEFTLRPSYLDVTSLNEATHRYITQHNDVRANLEFICCD